MIHDKDLHLIMARAVKDVYDGKGHNIGSVEWNSTVVEYQGQPAQLLAIAGTNEMIDWLWNLLLFSWDGVKIGSYLAAHLIHSGTWGDFEWLRKGGVKVKSAMGGTWRTLTRKPPKESRPVPVFKRDFSMPLLVAVHSKSGPTGMYWVKRFSADLCTAFCPARGLRKAESMKKTAIIYVDPDDPVPKLGKINFHHPKCHTVHLPNDPGLMRIKDHSMDHIIEFLS